MGLYPCGATPEGVEDMAGNVWEWTESWYDESQTEKVLRGGSRGYEALSLRSSARSGIRPELKLSNFGFRVARDVSEP